LALAWQPGGNPKASQPDVTGCRAYQDVGRLDVFMYYAAMVKVANRFLEVDRLP
jgi:hypothetical protein